MTINPDEIIDIEGMYLKLIFETLEIKNGKSNKEKVENALLDYMLAELHMHDIYEDWYANPDFFNLEKILNYANENILDKEKREIINENYTLFLLKAMGYLQQYPIAFETSSDNCFDEDPFFHSDEKGIYKHCIVHTEMAPVEVAKFVLETFRNTKEKEEVKKLRLVYKEGEQNEYNSI